MMNWRSWRRITIVFQHGSVLIANLLNVNDVVPFQELWVAFKDMSAQCIFGFVLLSHHFSASEALVCWIPDAFIRRSIRNCLRYLAEKADILPSTTAETLRSGLVILFHERFTSQLGLLRSMSGSSPGVRARDL